jgi:hypothetical protein
MKTTEIINSNAVTVFPSSAARTRSSLRTRNLIAIFAILPALAISTFAHQPVRLAGSSVTNPANAAPQGALNPAYMKEFPPVDQVMSKVKGSSASDTTIRQIAALRQFKHFIEILAGSRFLRGQLTPDEKRIYGDYDVQYNNLAKPLNFPDDSDYYGRRDFIDSLFATFQMPTVQQQWTTINSQNVKKDTHTQQPPANQPSNPTGTNPYSPIPTGTRPLPATNDPGQLAMRRCVELGGGMLDCIAKGMTSDAQILMGMQIPKGNPHGIVIFGSYLISGGTTFAFTDGSVVIRGCGKLAAGNHNYSVQAMGAQFVIKVDNSPQPVLVGVGADGKLTGPASQVITGLQVTGETVTYNKVTGAILGKAPIYGAITLNCAIGTLPPGPAQEIQSGGGYAGAVLGGIFSIFQSMSGGGGAAQSHASTLAPGPRFIGVYTNGSDFRIQFNDASAIIDCKQAHIMASYDVSDKGGAAMIAVKNGTTPFALTVTQNGTLAGPASVTVNGKLFTAMQGSDPVLTPTSASCSLASLAAATAGR